MVESSIARESDGIIYTHAGPEIGVASTKAFTTQLVGLFLFSLHLGQVRGKVDAETFSRLVDELLTLPRKIEEVLGLDAKIEEIAKDYMAATDFLYLGRGISTRSPLRGAQAQGDLLHPRRGYPAGEMKHGPIALIDEQMPVVVVVPENATSERWSRTWRRWRRGAAR